MKSVMRRKVDEWAETVTDPVVKKIIKDNAIFHELIGLLKKDMHENGKKEIDQAYLAILIDRIF